MRLKVPLRGAGLLELRRARPLQRLLLHPALLLQLLLRRRRRAAVAPSVGCREPRAAEAARHTLGGGRARGGRAAAVHQRARGPLPRDHVLEPRLLLAELRGPGAVPDATPLRAFCTSPSAALNIPSPSLALARLASAARFPGLASSAASHSERASFSLAGRSRKQPARATRRSAISVAAEEAGAALMAAS